MPDMLRVVVFALLGGQALFIGMLLFARARRKRTNEMLRAAARVFRNDRRHLLSVSDNTSQLYRPCGLCFGWRIVRVRYAVQDSCRVG